MKETSLRPAHGHTVKDWAENERPRERMKQLGAEALSDAELVAILLRSGMKGKDVISCARELIKTFGGLRGLGAAGWPQLSKIKGLGPAKISTLVAAGEIARRQLREEIPAADVIRDPEAVAAYLKNCLRDQKVEIFKVLFLNKANRVIAEEDMARGTVDEAAVHPREIVKAALEKHATAVILVHNHPSGRTDPSGEDRSITQKIKAACETVSVKVLDHIIVGGNQLFSFREHGLL